AKRTPQRAHVGLGKRRAARIALINARSDPRSLFDQIGEHAQLKTRARRLAFDARRWKRSLFAGAIDQIIAKRFDVFGGLPKKSGFGFALRVAPFGEGRFSEIRRRV